MKNYWVNYWVSFGGIVLGTVLVTLAFIAIMEINVFGRTLAAIILVDLGIIGLANNLYYQSVRIDLLRTEFELERRQQDARYQELQEKINKL